MKIKDGLKLPGRTVTIPDCDRNDLPEFMRQMGCRVGAEIGVDKGEYTEVLCQGGLYVYAIDPWVMYEDYFEPTTEDHYVIAKDRLAKYDCRIIKRTSMEALQFFKDDSLDFVYIDGNHSFVYIAQDIYYWSKKVRKGGIVAGHDYYYHRAKDGNRFKMNVRHVVDCYVKAAGIKKLYILGSKEMRPGEKRDRYRSWFWIKP